MERVTVALGPTNSAAINRADATLPSAAPDETRFNATCSGRSMMVAGPFLSSLTGTEPRRQRATPFAIVASRMMASPRNSAVSRSTGAR